MGKLGFLRKSMDAKYKGFITCSSERLGGNVAVLLVDPQKNSEELERWGKDRELFKSNVMELVGIKIDLTKLDCLNQKKKRLRGDMTMFARMELCT